MSAGPFSVGKYERDNGTIHPVTCQPETVAATIGGEANGFVQGAGGAVDSDISAQISGSRRSIGLHARKVSLKFGTTPGSFPDGYKAGTTLSIPIFQKDLYDSVQRGDSAEYLGVTCLVTSKQPEVAR